MTVNNDALARDAKNRSIRTILQNLAFDILLAVTMLLLPIFTTANGWGDFEWKVMAFSVFRTVTLTIFAYVNRRLLDPSPIPTVLPPDPPGEPDADHNVTGMGVGRGRDGIPGLGVVEKNRDPNSPPQRAYRNPEL